MTTRHPSPEREAPASVASRPLEATKAFLARASAGRRAADRDDLQARVGDPTSLEGLSGFIDQLNGDRQALYEKHPFRGEAGAANASAQARRRSDGTLRMTPASTPVLPALRPREAAVDRTTTFAHQPLLSPERTGTPPALTAKPASPPLDDAARACAQTGCPIAHTNPTCLRDFRQCDRPAQRLALAGFKLKKLAVRKREIFVFCEIEGDPMERCPRCGGFGLQAEEVLDDSLRDRPVAGMRVRIFFNRRCVRCRDCGRLSQQALPAMATADMTDRLLEWIAEQTATRPIEDVAREAGIPAAGFLLQLVDARRTAVPAVDSSGWAGSSGWLTPPQLATSRVGA